MASEKNPPCIKSSALLNIKKENQRFSVFGLISEIEPKNGMVLALEANVGPGKPRIQVPGNIYFLTEADQ
ncbi:hypothetical protein [Rufibacter sp. LB8]|uniref:hypothetical protein n=1 Tax=Rufibacter sp. LB8 TaxID=2777781 RepID=UPI00178C441B|nr:hypothetical protein [Rufibacter sp. LB8]